MTKADLKFLELTCPALNNILWETLRSDSTIVVVLKYEPVYSVHSTRMFIHRLKESGCDAPVIMRCDYQETDLENLQIKAAVDFGTPLIDGIGNGLFLCNEKTEPCLTDRYMFSILQATRARISKTEYISCPGCGRTLYDLQTTIALIKKATSHLKGLKIGIMGCIVNGPGEMADADYGYVGAGRGQINLYKGKTCVLKNILEEDAVEQLVGLIKANGDWK
jgi:(E)-4-hydroxy-3-methylbut-2-enyl-diphosphate synthase